MRNAGVHLEVLEEGWCIEGSAPVHSSMFFKMLEMPSMEDVYDTLDHKRNAQDSILLEKRLNGTDS